MSTRSAAPSVISTFDVRVTARHQVSESFLRLTFTGSDLEHFAAAGLDQRIKVALPLPQVGFDPLPRGPGYFERRRELPHHLTNPIRTYTVRTWRPAAAAPAQLDVDFVVHHGPTGPAARWAQRAQVGDPAVLIGPDARMGPAVGAEFRPGRAERLLIAGDETAVPAALAIVEQLGPGAVGTVLLEVPHPGDMLQVRAPVGVHVRYLVRGGAPHGHLLAPAVRAWSRWLSGGRATASGIPPDLTEVDVDRDILWDVPGRPAHHGVYVWLAGEAAVIRDLRRHLVMDVGMARDQVAFMGYWRRGHALP